MKRELGIKFAADARTCQGQGLNKVAGRLTRGGAPCSVWPKKEEDMVAEIGAREIIMVTDRETGIATVRQRGADPMAGRSAMRQGLSMEERAVRSRSCAEPTQEPGRRKRMQLDWGRRGWTSHNCFGPPSLMVEGLLSKGPTPSSFNLLVEMGLPLHLFPAYMW